MVPCLVPSRVLVPSETSHQSGLYGLHFCQHSGLLNSHQHPAYRILRLRQPTAPGSLHSSCKLVLKAYKRHGQIYHSHDPISWHQFSVLLFSSLRQNIERKQFKEGFILTCHVGVNRVHLGAGCCSGTACYAAVQMHLAKVDLDCNPQRSFPNPLLCVLQLGPSSKDSTTSPSSIFCWGPSVQIHEPVEDISPSSYHM